MIVTPNIYKTEKLLPLIMKVRNKWLQSQKIHPYPTHLLLNSDGMLLLDKEVKSDGLCSGCSVCGLILLETVDESVRLAYIP